MGWRRSKQARLLLKEPMQRNLAAITRRKKHLDFVRTKVSESIDGFKKGLPVFYTVLGTLVNVRFKIFQIAYHEIIRRSETAKRCVSLRRTLGHADFSNPLLLSVACALICATCLSFRSSRRGQYGNGLQPSDATFAAREPRRRLSQLKGTEIQRKNHAGGLSVNITRHEERRQSEAKSDSSLESESESESASKSESESESKSESETEFETENESTFEAKAGARVSAASLCESARSIHFIDDVSTCSSASSARSQAAHFKSFLSLDSTSPTHSQPRPQPQPHSRLRLLCSMMDAAGARSTEGEEGPRYRGQWLGSRRGERARGRRDDEYDQTHTIVDLIAARRGSRRESRRERKSGNLKNDDGGLIMDFSEEVQMERLNGSKDGQSTLRDSRGDSRGDSRNDSGPGQFFSGPLATTRSLLIIVSLVLLGSLSCGLILGPIFGAATPAVLVVTLGGILNTGHLTAAFFYGGKEASSRGLSLIRYLSSSPSSSSPSLSPLSSGFGSGPGSGPGSDSEPGSGPGSGSGLGSPTSTQKALVGLCLQVVVAFINARQNPLRPEELVNVKRRKDVQALSGFTSLILAFYLICVSAFTIQCSSRRQLLPSPKRLCRALPQKLFNLPVSA